MKSLKGNVMMRRWAYPLFNLLLIACLPLLGLVVLVRWHRRVFSRGGDRWDERWGRFSPETLTQLKTSSQWWWVHAVSMGEVKAIAAFLNKAPQQSGAKILLSVVTPEAISWATENKVADCIVAAPLDLPWIVRRSMQTVKPRLFLSVESEFWPNLLREAQRAGARVALINGRISERSFHSYQRIHPLLPALWDTLDLFSVRQKEDAERFAALGVPQEKIVITGNLKYDLYVERRAQSRSPEAPVVVLGSTREGEERRLLPAMAQLCTLCPEVQIIWAPRHIERIPELEALLKAQGLSYRRVTEMRQSKNGARSTHVLWDSMGDLLEAYKQAHVAVIGGSFVSKGGQNPIEPAALKLPVLFGPSMDNFQGVAESLLQSGGALCVSADDLGEHLSTLIKNPQTRKQMGERAHQTVLLEQGATDRTLELLKGLLHA